MSDSEWFPYAPLGPTGAGEPGAATGPGPPAPRGWPWRSVGDLINEAADTRRYWVLCREPDEAGWTLRHLDDTTGEIGPAEHTFDGADPADAGQWASDLTGVTTWAGYGGREPVPGDAPDDFVAISVDAIRPALVRFAWRQPRKGKALRLSIEDDPHTPGLRMAMVREWWPATGRVGSTLSRYEMRMFRDVGGVLDWASEAFGVDRDQWLAVTPGSEWTSA